MNVYKRTATITASEGFENTLLELEVSLDEKDRVIGHLLAWGFNSTVSEKYIDVTVHCSHTGDIYATYRNAQGEVTNSIGATWEKTCKRCCFHS